MSSKQVDISQSENSITGQINVSRDNEKIKVINSYENFIKYMKDEDLVIDDSAKNENEIKDNIEINITKEGEGEVELQKIEYPYLFKFNKKGTYNIKYSFKNNLSKTNHMFCYCKSLTKLDFSNFNTQDVTDMRMMFEGCEGLTELNLSNFNTENVTNMCGMFFHCDGLTQLNLSSFNTVKVTNMSEMFYYCKSLTDLDLSSFNTQNVKYMSNMFSICPKLTNLKTSTNFIIQKNADTRWMFDDDNRFKNLISAKRSKFCDCFSNCFGCK